MMNKLFTPLLGLLIPTLFIILTSCNSEGIFIEATVKLKRIDVIASPITTQGMSQTMLAIGNKQPFEVVGHYSDGSSHPLTDLTTSDWHTSNSEVGRFNEPGVLTAISEGEVTIVATKDGVTSNTVTVNVTAAVITDITVTPSPVSIAKGQTQLLVATATYSDNSSSDVSNSVSWVPIDTATATVTPAGLLSGVEVGSTTLTASKDGVTSNTVTVNVTAAVITDITVTPSPVSIAKGQTQLLVATATYSDNSSSDVSNSVSWVPIDTATATVTPAGLLSGVEVGSTTLTASKDGVTSNTVTVNVCGNLAGTCIDIFDTGSGKLFTNSPSVVYLDSIGGSATNSTNNEPSLTGAFYRFDWNNANTLCNAYNVQSVGGRTNWRLATKDELKTELYDVLGNMFTARGWPTSFSYWSVTPDGSLYFDVDLAIGIEFSGDLSYEGYASCVSNP